MAPSQCRARLANPHEFTAAVFLVFLLCGLTAPVVRAADEDEKPKLLTIDEAEKLDPRLVSTGKRLFVANVNGSGMRLLIPDVKYHYQGTPRWSPDGKLIAFDVYLTGANAPDRRKRIEVVKPDGTESRLVVHGGNPSFSPDGKQIAFCQYNGRSGVWVASVDGEDKDVVQIDPEGGGPVWSSDGNKIAYITRKGDEINLTAYDVVTQEKKSLLGTKDSNYKSMAWDFAWSPDSKQIVILGVTREGTTEMVFLDTEGNPPKVHTRLTQTFKRHLAWSPDGKTILFSMEHSETNKVQLFRINVEGNTPPERLPRQRQRSNSEVSFSPDGKQIVFCSVN